MKLKGEMATLDELDLRILRQLQDDAKQTYSEIGSRLNVAHSTVYDRIQKMEELGVIRKYEALINPEKLGLQQIVAHMIITTDPKETESIADGLAKFGQVLEVSTSFSEELVVLVKVVAKDQGELHSFIARSVAPLTGVLRIRTAIVTKKYKDERSYLFPRVDGAKRKE